MPRFEYQGSELLVAWERVILLHLRLGILWTLKPCVNTL